MRIGVISDIHGNWHALEAVLHALEGESPDAVWCLGDLVGYGPRPNSCCAAVQERADVCLSGNHDLGVLGTIDLDEFSSEAAESARWTREVLDRGSRSFLERLSPSHEAPEAGASLYHASPRDPVWEYVLTVEAASAALRDTLEPVVLVGHSHVAIAVSLDDDGLGGGLAPGGTDVDLSGSRWLLNPGSVGQPRDGDPRAAYVVLDLSASVARFRRVAYDIEKTQSEIRGHGLPESLATRLARGL